MTTVRTFTFLVLGVVFALPARPSAYTAAASGNWNAPATWGGTGIPGVGDTVSLGDSCLTVTVASDTAAGAGAGTPAIAMGACGTVALAQGVTLSIQGDVTYAPGNADTFRQAFGSTIEFDGRNQYEGHRLQRRSAAGMYRRGAVHGGTGGANVRPREMDAAQSRVSWSGRRWQ